MTGSYSLFIKKSAERELRKIPKGDLKRIVTKIKSLVQNPRSQGSEKLSEQERYRIRQGDYRIVYAINDNEGRVDIIKIGHHREVYR
ncbi:MAG: type II toxin-antitoxin system RelE family toxin, partial [Nitrospirales bacterium]